MAKAAVKKKTPQQKRRTLERKADALFSKIVRLRDGGCVAADYSGVRCGGVLQGAHVWSRSYRAVRFDEKNDVALCQGHHLHFTHHPFEWYEFMAERLGQREWALLRERALFGKTPDYDEVIPRLQERLRELDDA